MKGCDDCETVNAAKIWATLMSRITFSVLVVGLLFLAGCWIVEEWHLRRIKAASSEIEYEVKPTWSGKDVITVPKKEEKEK